MTQGRKAYVVDSFSLLDRRGFYPLAHTLPLIGAGWKEQQRLEQVVGLPRGHVTGHDSRARLAMLQHDFIHHLEFTKCLKMCQMIPYVWDQLTVVRW